MKRLLVCVIVVMLAACASVSKSASDFEISLIRYEKALRWHDIEVLKFMHKEGTYQPAQLHQYKNIRIGKYETLSRQQLEGKKIAHKVVIGYFFKDDYRVKEIEVEQMWEFDKQLNRWLITSPLPVLR